MLKPSQVRHQRFALASIEKLAESLKEDIKQTERDLSDLRQALVVNQEIRDKIAKTLKA